MAVAPGSTAEPAPEVAPMRPPGVVMRFQRLGAFHATRLSFGRSLIRRMGRESWRFTRRLAELDDQGFGRMVYEIETPKGLLSFVGFSNYLADEDRTDRVIAEKWDAAFALAAGRLGEADLKRLAQAAPRQEAGRFGADELVLSRANKSVRLYETVAAALAAGRQPDLAQVVRVGYLMRTTAVYGNGKFGLADLARVWRDGVFSLPYEAEMLTVYLIREFSFALIEHIARARNPAGAVPLATGIKRALGIGNATGLGMAPFLIGHPMLFNNWIAARERALARVRAVPELLPAQAKRFRRLMDRAIGHVGQWATDDERQAARIALLAKELAKIRDSLELKPGPLDRPRPWDALIARVEAEMSAETAELLASLVIELHPELADDLEHSTGSDEKERIDPAMTLAELKALIERAYGWALPADYENHKERHFFWYRSAEKDEPRLGERFNEPGAELELPLGIGFMAARLHGALARLGEAELGASVAEFLLANPRWRGILRRVQSLAHLPYGEIQDNTLSDRCLPIDLLRCKLSIFGAAKFDPKSDRWTRITLFQGAPTIEELGLPDADDWAFPYFPF